MIDEYRRQKRLEMESQGYIYWDDTHPEPIRNIYKAINKKIGEHVGHAHLLRLEISHLLDVVEEQEKKIEELQKTIIDSWDTVQHDAE